MRKIRKISKKGLLKKQDKVWREAVVKRDNYSCQVCNKKLKGINCQAHHILPRQFIDYRWDINNGITLCYYHHKVGKFSPHLNPMWFDYWLYKYNPDTWLYINKAMLITVNGLGDNKC